MRRYIGMALAAGLVVAACATNAFAQTETQRPRAGELHGLFQVGGTTGAEASAPQRPKLAVGADFGEAINHHVEVYLAGGWQEEVPQGLRDTFHLTSGIKLIFGEAVRPYALVGGGVMHLRLPEMINVEGKNKFLGEVGAGLAFPVGTGGYIDVGYRYFKPYNFAGFTPNGLFVGLGFRY
jgi:opacity protein-like surface antigen